MLAANTEEQWQSLCRVLNNDTLATEPRWKTSSDRSEHAADLRTILAEELATKTTNEWDIQLNEAGVPAGSVMRLAEILDHAQCQAREITQAVHLPETSSTPHLPTLGFKANGYSVAPSAAPPTLGRDTETILLELGFDKDEITALREKSVI